MDELTRQASPEQDQGFDRTTEWSTRSAWLRAGALVSGLALGAGAGWLAGATMENNNNDGARSEAAAFMRCLDYVDTFGLGESQHPVVSETQLKQQLLVDCQADFDSQSIKKSQNAGYNLSKVDTLKMKLRLPSRLQLSGANEDDLSDADDFSKFPALPFAILGGFGGLLLAAQAIHKKDQMALTRTYRSSTTRAGYTKNPPR